MTDVDGTDESTLVWCDRIDPASAELFRDAVARGDQQTITRLVDVIWQALDRGALWAASLQLAGSDEPTPLADKTCTVLLPALASHVRAVAALGRAGFSHMPSAMAAARAGFEAGLRIGWVYSAKTAAEVDMRSLSLHQVSAEWREKIAGRLESIGTPAERWHHAAAIQRGLVTRATNAAGYIDGLPHVPSVFDQLRQLGIERTYLGYQLASEYVHGALGSGLELGAVSQEDNPFGMYWPQDWYLPVNMCAWGCVLVAQHAQVPTHEREPVDAMMWASDVLLSAPGHGDGGA